MKSLRLVALAGLVLAASAVAQTGQVIYVVDGGFEGNPPQQTSRLYRIDPEDGSILETVGDTGENLVAITMHDYSGVIYGVTAENSAHPRNLVRVDPETAETTFVGELFHEYGEEVLDIHDLMFSSFDTYTSGVVYETGDPALFALTDNQYPGGLIYTDIFGIRLDDAKMFEGPGIGSFGAIGTYAGERAAVMLPVGAGYPAQNMSLLGCDESGMEANLITYIMAIFPLDPPPPNNHYILPGSACFTSSARLDPVTMFAISIPEAGDLPRLHRIDIQEGSVNQDLIGPLPSSSIGIAIGPPQVTPVPMFSSWALTLLVAGIGLIGVFCITTIRAT